MSNDEPNQFAPAQRQHIESKDAPAYFLKERMARLVDAVLEGRVVPFLGAGISQRASKRPDLAASKLPPHPPLPAGDIAEILGEALRKFISSGSNHVLPTNHLVNRAFETACHKELADPKGERERLFNWLDLNYDDLGTQLHRALKRPDEISDEERGASDRTSQGSYATPIPISVIPIKRGSPTIKPMTPLLGEIAELCWAILGPVETCNLLRLEEWNRYLPTPAHHHLAMLVREGLVTEILETNYDEFVEEAVMETFGSGRRHFERKQVESPSEEGASLAALRQKKRKPEPAPVIHDLDSYRKYIAQPRRPSQHDGLVKVVKLNGCAKAYRDNIASSNSKRDQGVAGHEELRIEAAQKILLTEEQLQSWGPKSWAQDLLRDRVRSRALLFIGFGNQDPIVRHHTVAVIREFGQSQSEHDRAWFEMENAPFVMEYRPNLTFFQFQILRAFRDAHEHKTRSPHRTLDQVATVYMNTFLGEDGSKLGAPPNTLPADTFMARVAGLAISKHISKVYFSSDSALGSYLRGALRQPEVLLDRIKRTLLDGDVQKLPHFESWLHLEVSGGQQISSAWAEVCFTIRGDDAGRAGYRPFLDAPVKQPMLLALMVLLTMSEDTSHLEAHDLRQRCGSGTKKDTVAGFRLLDGDLKEGRCPLYATSYYNAFIGDVESERVAGSPRPNRRPPNNAVVLLLGRGTQAAFRRHRWISTDDGEDERDLVEVIAIGDLLALRGSSFGTVSLAVARQNLERLTRTPEAALGSEENWQDYCVEES